ncbi:MAG: peptidoglycan D,D-transpeptidase FtsI family protein [Acidimicrobiales bacterium]
MNRQIRRFSLVIIVLYALLFLQLNNVQLRQAAQYRRDPQNTREIEQAFTRPRGPIMTADGQIIAESVEVEGELEMLRVYPEGDLYAHTGGFLSLNFGAAGLERRYNAELSGTTIRQQITSLESLLNDEPTTGTVFTTLDADIQRAARSALAGQRGSVVAMRPSTGEILAMYSNPTFDPNDLSSHDLSAVSAIRTELTNDPQKPLLARTYRETFEPGSTFKSVTASAGLQSGLVTVTEPVYPVTDSYTPPLTSRPIRNFAGSSCGGVLEEILRVSCNTAFAQMGVDLGAEIMVSQAESFGFNSVPPFQLEDGIASVFPAVAAFEQNTPLLAQAAIGQFDVRSTPLQMVLVASAIANNGIVMEPSLVSSVVDAQGNELISYEPRQWKRAMQPENANIMRELMGVVATSGTARRMLPEGSTGGGKTGTAQLGQSDLNHAWIIGFAPLQDPDIAIVVIIESTDGTGGTVAAPVAQEVLRVALAQ